MKKEELQNRLNVCNIKYKTVETILYKDAIMKINGEWKPCVVYAGIDRFTNEHQVFCKLTEDFIQEFELIE